MAFIQGHIARVFSRHAQSHRIMAFNKPALFRCVRGANGPMAIAATVTIRVDTAGAQRPRHVWKLSTQEAGAQLREG